MELLSDERAARVSPPAGSHDDQLLKKVGWKFFRSAEFPKTTYKTVKSCKNISKVNPSLNGSVVHFKGHIYKWEPHE